MLLAARSSIGIVSVAVDKLKLEVRIKATGEASGESIWPNSRKILIQTVLAILEVCMPK